MADVSRACETSQILDGKAIAGDIRSKVAVEIIELKGKHPGFQPQLNIIQVYTYGK